MAIVHLGLDFGSDANDVKLFCFQEKMDIPPWEICVPYLKGSYIKKEFPPTGKKEKKAAFTCRYVFFPYTFNP